MINDCRLMVSSFSRIRLSHAYRKANFCTDALAKYGGSIDYLVDGGNMEQDSFLLLILPIFCKLTFGK